MEHACNSSTWEIERKSRNSRPDLNIWRISGQSGLHKTLVQNRRWESGRQRNSLAGEVLVIKGKNLSLIPSAHKKVGCGSTCLYFQCQRGGDGKLPGACWLGLIESDEPLSAIPQNETDTWVFSGAMCGYLSTKLLSLLLPRHLPSL
jgi:hypothetical protein